MMTSNNCGRCGKEIHKPEHDLLCEDCLRNQTHLDRVWLVIIGGIAGELIGMYLGRKWLSVELMYVCAASGLLLTGLIAVQFLSKLQRLTSGFIGGFTSAKTLTIAEADTLLKHYSADRRWIACENVIRGFLSQHDGAFKSPNLAKRVKAFAPGFTCCKNQFTHLIWYFGAGILFTFIAHSIKSGQTELPNLLEEAVPFLPRLNALNNDGVATVLWFVLISFALSVTLLLLGRQIPRKGIFWALLGCVSLLVLPIVRYGLSIIADSDLLTENQNVADLIKRYPVTYLPEVSAGFILFAKTGFLRVFWQALLPMKANRDASSIAPLLIFCSIVLLVYGQDLALFQYLPESICFLFLLTVSGCLYQSRPDMKRTPWLLIPCGGIVAAILTVRLESYWFSVLTVATALGITGFLVSPKKTLLMLWTITKLVLAAVVICQFVRWYCSDSAKTVLTLVSMWSIVGVWHVCSQFNRFDATILLPDIVHKAWLRRRYKNTDFARASIVDTEWYKSHSQIFAAMPPPPANKPASVSPAVSES
jgi:hypothetical protein